VKIRIRSRWGRLAVISGVLAVAAGSSMAASFSSSADPPYVVAATKAVLAREAPQTEWLGPTSGPKCQPGKKIVYVNIGENNPIGHLWGVYLHNAAKVCGWNYVNLDGHSSPADWVKNAAQAVALKPDGIVTSADAKTMHQPFAQAHKLGIPIVGLHGTAKPGPDPADYLYTNIVSNPQDIGVAMMQWVIADSHGKARVIFLYDAIYAISMIKRAGWYKAFKTCPTCKLLKDDNFPLSDVPTRMGTEATSWVQKYGVPFYVVAVAGADGTTQAYNRVRQGNQYQTVTFPEPIEMQSWQAVDEINRAIHKLPPSKFVQPNHIVVKSNVDSAGSKNNQYFPQNNYKQHYLKIWKG
jgi:ribose transport system substrate-binding protein